MDHDVRPADLRLCALRLGLDAATIDGGCDDAHGGVEAAAAGVNGGPLAAALADLARAVAEVSRSTGSAVRVAGQRLSENADRYESDDAASAERLSLCVPEEGHAPLVLPSPTPAVPGLEAFGPAVPA